MGQVEVFKKRKATRLKCRAWSDDAAQMVFESMERNLEQHEWSQALSMLESEIAQAKGRWLPVGTKADHD